MSKSHCSYFSAEQYNKFINKMLIGGLLAANVFLVFFIVIFCVNTNGDENKKFIRLEIASWILGAIAAITLICSTLYTSWVLRKLYGSDFSSTSSFILVVLAIFCLEFSTRSAYEWVMYHY